MQDHRLDLIQLEPGSTIIMKCHPIMVRWLWRHYCDPYNRSEWKVRTVYTSNGTFVRLVRKPRVTLWDRVSRALTSLVEKIKWER